MNVLDLFSGIGGFSLGLERAGMRTVAFCEIDPFCRRVLEKHWPGVPIFHDVTELRGSDVGAVDVICGGFPCQDISFAGKGAGLAGERSGLWSEYARSIGELRPRFVIVENVAALLSRGLDVVLGDLAALGFNAEWHCIPASAVGAPHRRDRLWIVAYRNADDKGQSIGAIHDEASRLSGNVADADSSRLERWIRQGLQECAGERIARQGDSRSDTQGMFRPAFIGRQQDRIATSSWRDWLVEPDVGRVANGIPSRVDRLRSLGNAVVPQIPEIIGRAIMASLSPQEQRDAR